ncbi:hypothetical protein [Nocardioides marmotae]|uniref:hypothetical protein n=1 Tax=Nocardioides marmotae TaxID=2663857 RepID=UPI0012B5CC2C|nr:hypothetical protein [Nocardioides marmotae]MBC9731941.1 hypothetical protein [Nocardioides marmotae]MTB83061.1 hypothetical protein [Nocardioides marmotae]
MTTTSPTPDARRSDRIRALAVRLSVVLAVAALVLGTMVWRALDGGPTVAADVGEQLPLRAAAYGRTVTLNVPGGEVAVRVGAPVETLGYGLLEVDRNDPRWDERPDLAAPEDGSLVPVSWEPRRAPGGSVEVRLIVGDQRVDLVTIVPGDLSSLRDDPTSVAVGVEGRPGVEDLTVEVEYDGLTQTADVASGEIDAGVAEALYERDRTFSAGCAEAPSSCEFVAADPDSPLRPTWATFVTSDLVLYPYDPALGWADEGTLWGAVRFQPFGVRSAENAAGDTWSPSRQSAPVVTLDGAEPVRREGLEASTRDVAGRVVFAVDTDAEPRELVVEQVLSFTGAGAPQDLPIWSRLPLNEVG